MAGSACGAPVGGSARESNLTLPQKERSAQRNCRHKRGRNAGTNTPCAHTARTCSGRTVAIGKRRRLKFSMTSHRTGEAAQRYHGDGQRAGLRRTLRASRLGGGIED